MKKTMLVSPALTMAIKPTEDIETARVSAIINDPITPIPPALQPVLKPFFIGRMPLPPSTNMAYKIGYIGGHSRIIPSVALEFFKQEAATALSNMEQTYVDWSVLSALVTSRVKTPLEVKLQAYFTTEWKRDLDGVIKFAIDAAFARLELNDNQVVRIYTEKLVDPQDPRVEIEIRCMPR